MSLTPHCLPPAPLLSHTPTQLIPLLSGDAFGSFPAYVPLDALRCPSCCRLSAPAGELRAMGVECGEFCFIFGSYTKFGATFSGVPSGNLRPQASQGLPHQARECEHHHQHGYRSSSSSSSWASLYSVSPWNLMGFPFLPALLVLIVIRPWPSCCPCQKFRM